ncbi:MAG: AAA family ATPase [Candidatus Riflebacteria bacterium]|nr:AAA family ATPase [Candidatus Riflebacteria bacterium]
MIDLEKDFLAITKFAVEGQLENLCALAKQRIPGIVKRRPDLIQSVKTLTNIIGQNSLLRKKSETALPVDIDSRLELLRLEVNPTIPLEPTWMPVVKKALESIIQEQNCAEQLFAAGLGPTKSMLFIGPPGVGKTLAARWLAQKIGRPLLILDLAAVMSSFLGRTGNNIRTVLDFARNRSSILLLDEFDAIAKRRDDSSEVGELKRLVTVLVQAIDDWPANGILLAATNHPELLDPAVWRRFDRIIEFPLPSSLETIELLKQLLNMGSNDSNFDSQVLLDVFHGKSFSEICKSVDSIKRESIVKQKAIKDVLNDFINLFTIEATTKTKLKVAAYMKKKGASQREISNKTGLSRDTIRKHLPENKLTKDGVK